MRVARHAGDRACRAGAVMLVLAQVASTGGDELRRRPFAWRGGVEVRIDTAKPGTPNVMEMRVGGRGGGQRTDTAVACGPRLPWPTSNCTRAFSSRLRKPLPVISE
ncbi:hypothetical protein UA75_07795 [Actinoalloteichus sp. GBA129-24]|uniref:Uncharacterized protein n=1 Tax=Actinoalloteichus fjordicus TaxID=1612552 RepID=A0AAC9L9K9_9PSEU|nr:hypothetical protein UA74_07815 [Actinoalloteichus fjordicus]APU19578.1 hypothetical protein UA75_07795 [Actinoalloteichus sp. GBA129-24]